MKKLRILPLLILVLFCMGANALAAGIPGEQNIVSVTDDNGYVTALTDDNASTAWTAQSSSAPDLTFNLYYASVGEIWLRNGYAYTQNWYNAYDRPSRVKVTVYYYVNQYTESYDSYRYTLTDAFRPSTTAKGWNSGYQRLLLPQQYKNVTRIELTIEDAVSGYNRTGATIADVIIAAGSHATATPRSYATATPKPYIVYVTPTPGPETEEDDPLVEYITPNPGYDEEEEDSAEVIIPQSTNTPAISVVTPAPTASIEYPTKYGVIAYSNQRIPTRYGPSIGYGEPGSFFSAGQEVNVVSKVWDDNNELYWYQIEFLYKDEWYRVYTTDSRIDIDPALVADETPLYEPLDIKRSLVRHTAYMGPGEEYKAIGALGADKNCPIYIIENGWAQVEYYDYGTEIQYRGWVPISVLYGE